MSTNILALKQREIIRLAALKSQSLYQKEVLAPVELSDPLA